MKSANPSCMPHILSAGAQAARTCTLLSNVTIWSANLVASQRQDGYNDEQTTSAAQRIFLRHRAALSENNEQAA